MLAKTEEAYPLLVSESFVNATFGGSDDTIVESAGMHLLLGHMSGGDSVLRDSALETTASLMRTNPNICVQLLKVNLLSNLILSVLREDNSSRHAIEAILEAAVNCRHRVTLLNKS